MAQDIVPVELGLTDGDLLTLWAPRWREDGEEWEAFLGHGEHIYCFDDAAELAAFIRTIGEHDLVEHPAWATVTGLAAPELEPDDNHSYDIVGVPELAAGDPDVWTLGELADTLEMVRTLAEVCELGAVTDVLDASPGFAMLASGPVAFQGKDGAALWSDLGKVLLTRWDEVLDALDAVVFVPEVDAAALEAARAELVQAQAEIDEADEDDAGNTAAELDDDNETDDNETDEDLGFWDEVGIDPVKIITSTEELYTLRCYLDDSAVFLGSGGLIDVFTSPKALTRHLVDADDHDHDLATLLTWPEVRDAAVGGELEIEVHEDNTYVLPGLATDIAAGPAAVDATQLELGVELFTDAAAHAGDESVQAELAGSSPLGWFVSFVLEPSPNRMAPSAPFDAESQSWQRLEEEFEGRLRRP